MMNVKFVRIKSNEKRIFLLFFSFFENFFDILPKKETRLIKTTNVVQKGRKREKKENAETRRKELCKKESILLVDRLRIFVLVIVTDFTCRG